jgi:hypothetical protein
MSAAIPTIEPAVLRAGDTWKWSRSFDDYPATTWTLKYRFKHPTAAGFEIVASASGTGFSVSHSATTTTGYTAGTYTWIAWVESGTEKYTVDQGTVVVEADYRTAAASAVLDDRTHARKVLDAIEAVLENRASLDQERYMISGRELWRTPIPTLLKLRQTYRNEVRAEGIAQRIEAGIGGSGRVQIRL